MRAAKAQEAGSGSGSAKVVSRVLDLNALDRCDGRVAALADEIDAILRMEKEERAMGDAERDVRRGENLVGFGDEIASRPRRTWFAGERDKQHARERGARELNGAAAAGKGKSNAGGKLSAKKKKRLDDRKMRKEDGQEAGPERMWKKPKSRNPGPGVGGGGKRGGKKEGKTGGKTGGKKGQGSGSGSRARKKSKP